MPPALEAEHRAQHGDQIDAAKAALPKEI